jgi:hypothetical protein
MPPEGIGQRQDGVHTNEQSLGAVTPKEQTLQHLLKKQAYRYARGNHDPGAGVRPR